MASPLRSQLQPRNHSSSHNLLRLQHLQQLATWASVSLPPLAPFLGSRLASTCESLGCPPPPSPHLTCQRCESILLVGQNCSVRIRKSFSKKRRSAVGKAKSINNIVYICHFCSSETRQPGTPKSYVKTKINELAARNALSKLGQSVSSNSPDNLKAWNLRNNKSIFPSKSVLSVSPSSSIKKTKRKGWVSLKELTASTTASPGLSGSKMTTPTSNSLEGSNRFKSRVLDVPTTTMAVVMRDQLEHETTAPWVKGETSEKSGTVKEELVQQSIIHGATIDGCVGDAVIESEKSLQNSGMMKLDLEQEPVTNDARATSGEALLLSHNRAEVSFDETNTMKANLDQKAAMHDASPIGDRCLEYIAYGYRDSVENSNAVKSDTEQKVVKHNASPTGNQCSEDIIIECGMESLYMQNEDRIIQQRMMDQYSILLDAGVKGSINSEHETKHLLKDACVQTSENIDDSMVEEKQLTKSLQKQPGRGRKHRKAKMHTNLFAIFHSLKRQLLVIPMLKTEIHYLSNKLVELTNVVSELANKLNEIASPVQNVNPGKSMSKVKDDDLDISPKIESGNYSGKPSEVLINVNDVEARFPSSKKMHPRMNGEVYGPHVPRERAICKSLPNSCSRFESMEVRGCKNSNGRTVNSRTCKSSSRKIPVFWRYGRRWFAVCKTYGKLRYRIV